MGLLSALFGDDKKKNLVSEASAQPAIPITVAQPPAMNLQSAIQEQAKRAALTQAVAQQPIAQPTGFVPTPGQQVVTQGPGGLIQGQATDALAGSTMPLAQATKEYEKTKRSTSSGTKEKGDGYNLGNFIQSIGYGLIDKPLDRDATTWDYLGKTIGQIGRLTEGSGLGAGQSMHESQIQQDAIKLNKTVYAGLQKDLSTIPEAEITGPNKMQLFRELLRKYPAAKTFLAEYFGLSRNYDYALPQLKTPTSKYDITDAGVE